jgi:kynurenine formamidase
MLPKIDYMDHHQTAPLMAEYMGIRVDQLPDGEYAAVERAEISTHNGTHMDAPYHFFSTMNHALKPGGEPSWRIDEVPLDWCFQPGVKLDFRHLPDGYVATAGDVEAELKRIGHTLRPLEIVVVNTSAGARYGEDNFVDTGCGMGKAATLWLTERGVRVVGTDAWSWDAPFSFTRERVAATGDVDLIWEGHRAGREIGYFQMEKLGHLADLPAHGFDIICFPVKVHRASAGWTRAVAVFND